MLETERSFFITGCLSTLHSSGHSSFFLFVKWLCKSSRKNRDLLCMCKQFLQNYWSKVTVTEWVGKSTHKKISHKMINALGNYNYKQAISIKLATSTRVGHFLHNLDQPLPTLWIWFSCMLLLKVWIHWITRSVNVKSMRVIDYINIFMINMK